MLRVEWLTGNELEVLADALVTEKARIDDHRRRSRSPVTRADAQWRLVTIEAMLDACAERQHRERV